MPPLMPPPPAPPLPGYIISGIAYYLGAAQLGVTITVDNSTTPGTPYTVTSAPDGSFVVNIANISAWSNGDTITILFQYGGNSGYKVTTVDITTFPVGEDIGIFRFYDSSKTDSMKIYDTARHRVIPVNARTLSGTVEVV